MLALALASLLQAAAAAAPNKCALLPDTDLSVPGQAPDAKTPSAAACCAHCGTRAPFFVWQGAQVQSCYCKVPPFTRVKAVGITAGSCSSEPLPPPGPTPGTHCPAGKVQCPWPQKGCCNPAPAPGPPPMPPAPPGPNSYACQPADTKSKGLPFCDTAKTFGERADDLVGRLTLAEKLALLHAKPGTDGCAFEDSGVPRLDIPIYAWTEEANTGADSSCLGPERCVTTFPSPANLGASFNRSLWRHKGEIAHFCTFPGVLQSKNVKFAPDFCI